MSNDANLVDAELEEATTDNEGVDPQDATETSSSAKQEEKEELNLEEGKPNKKEEILKSFAEKLKDPDFDQTKVPDWVAKELGITSEKTDDFDEKLEAWEARKQFTDDKKTLDNLPTEIKSQIIREANELKSALGVSISKALSHVLKAKQDDIQKAKDIKTSRKAGAILPKASKFTAENSFTMEELSQIAGESPQEYKIIREKIDAGEMKIV